ncbi:MAG: LysE family translocator [Alphaproteobacteria bacterium]|nr:LysE family translocator [Alphaproteobacteria bacterium]
MEFAPTLLTLAGMHLLMAMLPGPNTVVVSWVSATNSRGAGLRATAGVVAATLVWVTLSLWGFGAVLLEAGWLYRLLRIAGAAYLVYVGVRMLMAHRRATGAISGSALPRPPLGGRRPFAAGLLTTLSNPKSAVFWTSAFLVAVPPHAPLWVHGAIVAIITVQSALWYGTVALAFSTGVARQNYLRFARRLDAFAGAVMVALGAKLADEVRREIAVAAAG